MAQHRTIRRRRSACDGFTLIEVLAALSLFAVVASGTGAMALQSMRHLVANRHGVQAAVLAQEELEYQRGLDYTDLEARSRTRSMGGQSYSIATTLLPDDPESGMTKISVTVSWTGPEGSKSYVVQTIYTTISS